MSYDTIIMSVIEIGFVIVETVSVRTPYDHHHIEGERIGKVMMIRTAMRIDIGVRIVRHITTEIVMMMKRRKAW